jgi:hypothetical protein
MSIVQALLAGYMAGGPPPGTPPCDGYTTGLWSATSYSHKMLTAYGGDARTTRRSPGGSQAIGFSGNNVDLAGEAAYVGATPNDGYVSQSNDHSGGGNHWSQATTTAQPRTVLDGVSESFGYSHHSTSEALISDNNSGSVAAITLFWRGNQFANGGTQVVVEHTANVNSNDGFYFIAISGVPRVLIARSSGSVLLAHDYSGHTLDGSVYCARYDVTEGVTNNRAKLYKNGTVLTPSGTPFGGAVTGNFANAKFYVGARGGTSLFGQIRTRHLAVYTGAAGLSDADIAVISARMAAL